MKVYGVYWYHEDRYDHTTCGGLLCLYFSQIDAINELRAHYMHNAMKYNKDYEYDFYEYSPFINYDLTKYYHHQNNVLEARTFRADDLEMTYTVEVLEVQ